MQDGDRRRLRRSVADRDRENGTPQRRTEPEIDTAFEPLCNKAAAHSAAPKDPDLLVDTVYPDPGRPMGSHSRHVVAYFASQPDTHLLEQRGSRDSCPAAEFDQWGPRRAHHLSATRTRGGRIRDATATWPEAQRAAAVRTGRQGMVERVAPVER